MKFRFEAFWLFLLTFVNLQLPQLVASPAQTPQGNHKQLSVDCCQGRPTLAEAVKGTAAKGMQRKSIGLDDDNDNDDKDKTHKGNEPENSTKLGKAARQTDYYSVIGDITTTATAKATTTTTWPDVAILSGKSMSKPLKLAKGLTANSFTPRLSDILANDEGTTSTIIATSSTTSTTSTSSSPSSSAGHQAERRHAMVPDKLQYTKEVQIKQGRLMGITRRFQVTSGLHDVDQYLGLPYAEAPTGSRRFMPPGAPLPWQGLKIARHLPPVCPQKLPDISPEGNANNVSRGRYKYLTRLMPYLKTESEDCLNLNLYVPHTDPLMAPKVLPVLVYLHGESFEWNSGNAYDGSVLASYGEIIVVTVNFRLGVLGFMRPSIDAHNIANYALLDQIAALHWIKENIGSFGGDPSRVTLMGHGTGAACVNYLMVSPVASGLFHRAILMSGSAMSDWAASNQTIQLTMQIAHALGCPLSANMDGGSGVAGGGGANVNDDDGDALLDCLRQRRYEDILNIPTTTSQFSTSLGPIVDGHVIPNQPYKVMGHYTEHFSRYDLLFGITESESYHTLAALALEKGLRENERDNLLRFYLQSRFDVRPDLALAATLKKYQDMYNNPIKATNLEHRDVVLDILSDARVVGPLLQTGMFHADVNRRNYMYVFGHNSATGPYANLPHSIMGEELAFIFGAPLAPAGPFPSTNYSVQEKLLSEAVMAYWTNFVKTGNPKAPWKGIFLNSHALEWDRYDLDWPEFNKRTQAFLNIGIPPTVGYKYRQIYMNFWNKELPDELNQIAAMQLQLQLQQQQPFLRADGEAALPSKLLPTRLAGSEVITGHMSKYGTRDNGAEDPVRTLKLLLQDPLATGAATEMAAENMYNAPPTFGYMQHHRQQQQQQQQSSPSSGELFTLPTNLLAGNAPTNRFDGGIGGDGDEVGLGVGVGDREQGEEASEAPAGSDGTVAKSETTLQLLIALIAVFIVLNVVIYTSFLLQKRRKRATSLQRKLGGILSYEGATDDELKRTASKSHDGDDSYILDMVRKSNTYEAVKTSTGQRSPINGYAITRQLSSSTVDTHTKVCEWMSGHGKSASPAFSSMSGSFAAPAPPAQVSVAVDATPMGRGSSVLEQEPIELTRLKALDGRIIICQDIEVVDAELLTPQQLYDDNNSYEMLLQRQHSALTEPSDAPLLQQQFQLQQQQQQQQPHHQHSRSDPLDMILCQQLASDEQVTSFVHADDVDINVTSRDDSSSSLRSPPLTAAQQLELLRQRNFPKVLPTQQRSSDSPPMTVDLSRSLSRRSYKRNSLPPHSLGVVGAPVPPPRTISTLGRQRRRDSSNITTSPLMLAQDCGDDEDLSEPQITQNTLIVGPIVPKSPATPKRPAESVTKSASSGTLTGSFQSFESVPPPHEATPPLTLPVSAQRTERVYAIQPSPVTTPTTPQSPENWPAPDGALYAQPSRSASRTSLIPRKLPLTPGKENTGSPPEATAATQAAPQVAPPVATLPQTRIPQLQRTAGNSTTPSSKTTTTAAATPSTNTTTTPTTPTTPTIDNLESQRTASMLSSGSSTSWCSSTGSSSSSSTGTVRTELQQQIPHHTPSRSITTNI